jgi:hypothetical protein
LIEIAQRDEILEDHITHILQLEMYDAEKYDKEFVRWITFKEIFLSDAEKDDILDDHVNHILRLNCYDAEDYSNQLEYFPEDTNNLADSAEIDNVANIVTPNNYDMQIM